MKIGEIASAAGVSTSRIRFYEKRGIIPPAIRDDNGYRDYSPDLIGQLNFIEQAQKLGFSTAILPRGGKAKGSGMELTEMADLASVVGEVFGAG